MEDNNGSDLHFYVTFFSAGNDALRRSFLMLDMMPYHSNTGGDNGAWLENPEVRGVPKV